MQRTAAATPINNGQNHAVPVSDPRSSILGDVLMMLMNSPRHQAMTLAEVKSALVPAVALGQAAVLAGRKNDTDPVKVAAVAWWAMVSPEVDERLSASSDEILKLDKDDWKSGDQPWIIDAAGEPQALNELLRRLMEGNFTNRTAKLRAILPDGRRSVGRLERRPAKPAEGA